MATPKNLPDLSKATSPLQGLAQGDAAKLTQAQRVALAKRAKKGTTPGPEFTLPTSVLGEG